MKSKCDYILSRNHNLRRQYATLLYSSPGSLDEVFAAVASSPAERFYISEERAYLLLLEKRLRGGWAVSLPTRRAMLEEIERRVEAMLTVNPGLSLKQAVFNVVNSPAPSFYLTPRSVRTILYR